MFSDVSDEADFCPSVCCVQSGSLGGANLDMNINKLLHTNSAGDFSMPPALQNG